MVCYRFVTVKGVAYGKDYGGTVRKRARKRDKCWCQIKPSYVYQLYYMFKCPLKIGLLTGDKLKVTSNCFIL